MAYVIQNGKFRGERGYIEYRTGGAWEFVDSVDTDKAYIKKERIPHGIAVILCVLSFGLFFFIPWWMTITTIVTLWCIGLVFGWDQWNVFVRLHDDKRITVIETRDESEAKDAYGKALYCTTGDYPPVELPPEYYENERRIKAMVAEGDRAAARKRAEDERKDREYEERLAREQREREKTSH